MTTETRNALYDHDKVVEAVLLLVDNAQVTELRVLAATTKSNRWPHTASGYFDDAEKLAKVLADIETAKGIYIVPNPVNPALLSRAENRMRKAPRGESTQDNDVIARRWLLIDTDPQRPSGISASDAEHNAALDRAHKIYLHLKEAGWPDPIEADSGNGAHLLYRIDLPADDGMLIRQCLEALANRFDDDVVKVDQTVFNPARIWKLYGTLACKGDDTSDRPHRLSHILNVPEKLHVVDTDLLQSLASEAATELPAVSRQTNNHNGRAFDIQAFIDRNSLDVEGPNDWSGQQGTGKRWRLKKSPLCEHGGDGPFIIQHASGAITARCHHNSCDWDWETLRQALEPGGAEREQSTTISTEAYKGIPTSGASPSLVCLADIEPRPIKWIWPLRIAAGRITLTVGMPGAGKSFLTCDMAARVSTGTHWPDGSECQRGSVVFITAEDDPHDTIRPRLDALGADVSHIHLLSGVLQTEKGKTEELMFSLGDVDILRQTLEKIDDCRLVVIDPIGSFLGGRCDAHRDNEVRSVLAPIAKLAEEFGPAVLIVAHRRKSSSAIADDTALGSRAFTGIARSVWHLSLDSENRDRRLLLPGKSNLAAEATGLAFAINGEPARVQWEPDPVEMTADEALAHENGATVEHSAVGEATDWLRETLSNGPRLSREIKQDAKRDGIAWRTVERARAKLGVCTGPDGFRGCWVWTLPDGVDSTSLRQDSSHSAKEHPLADTGR